MHQRNTKHNKNCILILILKWDNIKVFEKREVEWRSNLFYVFYTVIWKIGQLQSYMHEANLTKNWHYIIASLKTFWHISKIKNRTI